MDVGFEFINRFAQGLLSEAEALAWFDQLVTEDRADFLVMLAMAAHQSHPRPEEVELGLERSGLRRTFTPCVLLLRFKFNVALDKIRSLPDAERRKSVIALLHVFAVADDRRRSTECQGGCTHEWHNLTPEFTMPSAYTKLRRGP